MTKRTVLILFAHPSMHNSEVNRVMIDAIKGLDGVDINDLYENYPDFYIDVKREQALLVKSDLIIFQHPLYWYSSPAIIKEWQDVVLERGFAYGQGGEALREKDFMLALSTGGVPEAYQRTGYHYFTLEELLRRYRPPFVIQGSYELTTLKIREHAKKYREFLLDYLQHGEPAFEQLIENK